MPSVVFTEVSTLLVYPENACLSCSNRLTDVRQSTYEVKHAPAAIKSTSCRPTNRIDAFESIASFNMFWNLPLPRFIMVLLSTASFCWAYNTQLYFNQYYPETDLGFWMLLCSVVGGLFGIASGGLISDIIVSRHGKWKEAIFLRKLLAKWTWQNVHECALQVLQVKNQLIVIIVCHCVFIYF